MSAFELFQVRGKGLKWTLDKKSHKSRVSFLILNDFLLNALTVMHSKGYVDVVGQF